VCPVSSYCLRTVLQRMRINKSCILYRALPPRFLSVQFEITGPSTGSGVSNYWERNNAGGIIGLHVETD
jgi:hypothetical protein